VAGSLLLMSISAGWCLGMPQWRIVKAGAGGAAGGKVWHAGAMAGVGFSGALGARWGDVPRWRCARARAGGGAGGEVRAGAGGMMVGGGLMGQRKA
jgi:hypothetical protein